MEEWKVGSMEECGNSTIRPTIAIGATMEEWKNGMLEGWKNGRMWQFDSGRMEHWNPGSLESC